MVSYLEAWKQADGTYRIEHEVSRSSATYHMRDQFKKHGGKWDGKHWYLSAEAVQELAISRIFWVMLDYYCHESPHPTFTKEPRCNVGNTVDSFCGLCDSRFSATITEVLGEVHPNLA